MPAIAVVLLLALAVHAVVHLNYKAHLDSFGSLYTVDGEPMVTSADAYHYLDVASRLAALDAGRKVRTDMPPRVSLMVHAAVAAHKLTGISMERLAFWAPPVLTAGMVLVFLLFGQAMGRPVAGAVAAMFQSASPYWYLRTRVGFFDTDSMIPFLMCLAAYCTYRFATDAGWRRAVWLAALLATCLATDRWWPQTRGLTLAMSLGGYVISVLTPSGRVERRIKLGLLALALATAAGVALDLHRLLPGVLMHPLQALKVHALLALGVGAGTDMPVRVGELGTISSWGMLKFMNGSYVALAVGIPAVAWMFARRFRVAVFLLPLLAMGLLTPFSVRFGIFFVPLYSLGLGFAATELYAARGVREMLRAPWMRAALCAAFVAALVAPSMVVTMRMTNNPAFDSKQARLAREIGAATPEGTVIWSTWSKGYFLQFYSGRDTYSDGGTLRPVQLLIEDLPLSTPDPELAANWLKFFALRRQQGFTTAMKMLDTDDGGAVAFLRELFASRDRAPDVLRRHGQTDVDARMRYFFPDTKVALFLDHLMLRTAGEWFVRGTWDFTADRGMRSDIVWSTDGWDMMAHAPGLAPTTRGLKAFGRRVTYSKDGASVEELHSGSGWTLAHYKGERGYYLYGGPFAESLFVKLCLDDPDGFARFRKVFYNPRHGGLWMVE